jgi:cobalt-zinc-cadmium efflux system membrane fusion protein
MRRSVFIVLAVAAVTTPALAQHLTVSATQIQRLGIRTAQVTPAQTKTVVSALGRVTPAPGARLPVSAPFAGTVKTLIRLEGEQVKKGEALIVIVSSDMRDSLARLQSAQAHARTTGAAAARARALVKEGIAPASRAEEAAAAAAAARADLAALRSTMGRAARAGDGEYSLVAPANGRIAAISASAGDKVAAMEPVLALETGSELWVEAALPASQIGLVAAGDRAMVEGTRIGGVVVAAGSSIDAKTRSAVMRVRLDGGASLVPGQTVRLSVSSGAEPGSFNVPRDAVTVLKGRDVVFVARKGGFDSVPVRVLARGPRNTTVSGPLSARDAVAVSGVTELKAMERGS